MPAALIEPIGRAIVLVHPSGTVPAAEWTANVESLRLLCIGRDDIRILVWANGVIDSPQRKQIINLIKNRPPKAPGTPPAKVRVVMFTSSMVSRGVMQALGWMGLNVGSYSQANFARDIAGEGFTASETIELKAGIASMERRIQVSGGADAATS